MYETATVTRPIRAGVFSDIAAADLAVQTLLQAGFTRDRITVICSDQAIEQHFAVFEHQDPAGSHTAAAAAVGGTIGAVLGGLTVAIGAAATGGVAILATAGAAAWTGGVFGGLVGAMMTRGVERELADFYDQAVTKGKILVAADAAPDAAFEIQLQQLAAAEKILRDTGAQPVPLPEG
jgi:hypothetical protein